MTGIILQKGAFNPIHRMHLKIAEDVKKKYPDYRHFFLMSTDTCDKGVIPYDELARRAMLIWGHGYEKGDIRWTKSGLFVDNIKEIREAMGDIEIIFACGEDTIYRFFRDWERYYNDNHPDIYLKRFQDYDALFRNVKWYSAHRNCPELHYLREVVDRYCDDIIWSSLEHDDISSTMIRDGKQKDL